MLGRQKLKRQLQLRAIYRQNFIGAPLIILLHGYQIFSKSHLKRNRILPIRFKKNRIIKFWKHTYLATECNVEV
jgi:hypothetical protein